MQSLIRRPFQKTPEAAKRTKQRKRSQDPGSRGLTAALGHRLVPRAISLTDRSKGFQGQITLKKDSANITYLVCILIAAPRLCFYSGSWAGGRGRFGGARSGVPHPRDWTHPNSSAGFVPYGTDCRNQMGGLCCRL